MSAETAGQFDGGQVAFAVERAEKVGCGGATLEGVAFDATGDEVAVGIILKFDAGDDVVEAAHCGGESTAAIKAEARLTIVDGVAQGAALQEVLLLEAVAASGQERLGNRPGRTARISAGRRASTMGPDLLRSTRRNTQRAINESIRIAVSGGAP